MKSRNLSRDLGIGAMFVFVFVLATIKECMVCTCAMK